MKITRSFSRTKQISQYEPASFFCAIEEEIADPGEAETTSDELYQMAKSFVERDIENFQINDLLTKLNAQLKIMEFDLADAEKKQSPKLPELKFQVDLLKMEIHELSAGKK